MFTCLLIRKYLLSLSPSTYRSWVSFLNSPFKDNLIVKRLFKGFMEILNIFFLIFSSRGFIVSGFMFMSLIYFELIFVHGIRPWSIFILLYEAVQFYNTFYWGDSAFPIVYSCFLCHKLIDHLCVDLIIGSVLCSIDPGVCFYVSIIIF